MRLYTRRGDDGFTSLRRGARVRKDSPYAEALGSIDEAQASLGIVRAEVASNPELFRILTLVCRDLWALMAQLGVESSGEVDSEPGEWVTGEMVAGLEGLIDDVMVEVELPKDFVVPGQNRVSALLDASRAVVRRAERRVVSLGLRESLIGPYLNRLADLLWVLARWTEEESLLAREVRDEN